MELRIRMMPNNLHKVLKIKAIESGMTLNDFILKLIKEKMEEIKGE